MSMVSNTQISPDSLPSYIKELAPEARKSENVKKYHRLSPPCIDRVSNLEPLLASTSNPDPYTGTSKLSAISFLPEHISI
jgi:hypothetical protein